MLGVNHAYVTAIGRLIGVVALKELRKAIEDANSGGTVAKQAQPAAAAPPSSSQQVRNCHSNQTHTVPRVYLFTKDHQLMSALVCSVGKCPACKPFAQCPPTQHKMDVSTGAHAASWREYFPHLPGGQRERHVLYYRRTEHHCLQKDVFTFSRHIVILIFRPFYGQIWCASSGGS